MVGRVGGIELAADIIQSVDLDRAMNVDDSCAAFGDAARTTMRRPE